MRYRVEFTPVGRQMLRDLGDRGAAGRIIHAVEGLAADPGKQGKPLYGEFEGLRRARFSRFRVIYRVDERGGRVVILAVGMRKEGSKNDIYALAMKLARAGILVRRD